MTNNLPQTQIDHIEYICAKRHKLPTDYNQAYVNTILSVEKQIGIIRTDYNGHNEELQNMYFILLSLFYNNSQLMTDNQPTIESSPQKGNKGEKDEIKYKREIFEKRMDIEYCTALFGSDAQEGIEMINTETGLPYKESSDIKKTKAMSKADTIIVLKKTQKQLNISIKSKTGAKPSIINHTPRSAKAFQEEYLKDILCHIDSLAKEYTEKRKAGTIGEDVTICKLSSYSDDQIKQGLIKMLIYFTFKGTGSKKTDRECNSILIINRDGTLSFICCDTDEDKYTYIQTIIENSVISFRNKGMPTITNEECMPWVYVNDKGKDCGAIHIRLAHH